MNRINYANTAPVHLEPSLIVDLQLHKATNEGLARVRPTHRLNDVLLTGGGIMSNEDIEALKKLGVGQLFTPGAPMSAIVAYIEEWIKARASATAA